MSWKKLEIASHIPHFPQSSSTSSNLRLTSNLCDFQSALDFQSFTSTTWSLSTFTPASSHPMPSGVSNPEGDRVHQHCSAFGTCRLFPCFVLRTSSSDPWLELGTLAFRSEPQLCSTASWSPNFIRTTSAVIVGCWVGQMCYFHAATSEVDCLSEGVKWCADFNGGLVEVAWRGWRLECTRFGVNYGSDWWNYINLLSFPWFFPIPPSSIWFHITLLACCSLCLAYSNSIYSW